MLVALISLSLAAPLTLKEAHAADVAVKRAEKAKASVLAARFLLLAKEAPATPELREIAQHVESVVARTGLGASAEAARAKAQRLYDARNYGLAWSAFQKALELAPTNAGLWADVGLVSFKTGRKALGAQASRAAIALGDEAVRKSAAFNLGKFGQGLPFEEGALASTAGCSKSFEVRFASASRSGCDAHYCYSGDVTYALFAQSAVAAQACADSVTASFDAENLEQVSARAIGSTFTPPCAFVVSRDSMEQSGGVDENDQHTGTAVTTCNPVYVDACTGLVAFDCDRTPVLQVP